MRATARALNVAAEAKWSATRVECGKPASTRHPCGKADGHSGIHVCRCTAERALETMGTGAARAAS